MKTAKSVLETARKEIGTRESPANSNRTKYGVAYGWNGVAWCMIFVWWVFREAGAGDLLPLKTASCSSFMQASKQAGRWHTGDYQPGDVLIYNFGTAKSPQYHTGIVESVNGQYITAIEGNTAVGNESNGGEVMRRKRKSYLVVGAFRPKYEAGKPAVLAAQEVLDGKYGNGAERVEKLTAAGYVPADVQKIVNALSRGGLRAQITASVLNIRDGPGTGYKKLDIFGAGALVTVEEVRAGTGASAWGRVGNGWISLDYVKFL